MTMLLDGTDLATQSTVIQIIHTHPLLSQTSTLLFIVAFSDSIFILKTLISYLSFGLSRIPTVQSILFMPPANNITKTHSIIS